MRVLVACEESQAVTKELRRLGHEAYSCDVQECSGGHPEWHLQQDVIPLLAEPWDMKYTMVPSGVSFNAVCISRQWAFAISLYLSYPFSNDRRMNALTIKYWLSSMTMDGVFTDFNAAVIFM